MAATGFRMLIPAFIKLVYLGAPCTIADGTIITGTTVCLLTPCQNSSFGCCQGITSFPVMFRALIIEYRWVLLTWVWFLIRVGRYIFSQLRKSRLYSNIARYFRACPMWMVAIRLFPRIFSSPAKFRASS